MHLVVSSSLSLQKKWGVFTDLSAKQPLQESLLGRRGRLPSPVQVGRNRPVLVENIQLCEALRLDHLQDNQTWHLRDVRQNVTVSWSPEPSPHSARGWRRSLWTLCCRKTRLWAQVRLLSLWRTARCPARLYSRWPAAATNTRKHTRAVTTSTTKTQPGVTEVEINEEEMTEV